MTRPASKLPAIYMAALLVINIYVGFAIVHVFRTKGYAVVGDMRNLLPWALSIGVASTVLILIYALRSAWVRNLGVTFVIDLITSLLPLVLVRCLRIPDSQTRQEMFGLIFGLFIFSRASLLVSHALANVSEQTNKNSVRAWVLTTSLLIYLAITPWMALAIWPTSDEPAYLLLTHSLAVDHDFDLANNYKQRDYKLFYPPEPETDDHHTWKNSEGQEFPIHDVGISVLLLPGYVLGGYLGAMFEMNALAALLALGIFELALRLGATQRASLICWALFAFASPLIVYSSQIYPEVFGALCSLWAVIAFTKFIETKRNLHLALAGSFLAVLPWFSVRYWVILAPMLLIFALYTMVQRRTTERGLSFGRLSVVILPTLISAGFFSWFGLLHYDTLVPNAGYVLLMRVYPVPMFTTSPQVGLLGLWFDRAFGLLPTAPVYVLAIAGIWLLVRQKTRRWEASAILVPAAAYMLFAAFNRYWYGGWAPPPRYIFLSAALSAPLASLVLSNRKFGFTAILLTLWSVLVAVAYTAFPLTRYTLWDVNTGSLSQFSRARIGVDFGAVFPSFIRADLQDYLLTALWVGGVAVCVWIFQRTEARGRTIETSASSRV